MKAKHILFTTFGTPLGTMGLAAKNGKLIRVRSRISSVGEFKDFLESICGQSATKDKKNFEGLIQQFNLYFKRLLKTFSWPLDTSFGTHFQNNVWQILKTIPYGETRTYQWLAGAVGNPRASRAVGNANGENPLPIIIPCHRVIRKNGHLGGYSLGIDIKTFLLKLERTDHGYL